MRLRFTFYLASIVFAAQMCSAAEKPVIEDLLPDSTVAALLIPDLSAARGAAGKTRLADLYAQPEMQEFLRPALEQMRKTYAELKAANPILPSLEDIDTGLFSGGIGLATYQRPNLVGDNVGVLITLAPKDPEAFKRVLPQNIRGMIVEGVVVPLGGKDDQGGLAYVNGRVILCSHLSDLNQFSARAKDATPAPNSLSATAGFKAVQGKLSNAAAWAFVCPSQLVKMALVVAANNELYIDPKQVESLLKASGLANIDGYGMGIGFNGADPVCESYLSCTGGSLTGFPALANSDKPISARGLRIAGPDAPYVSAGHFNIAELVPLLRQVTQTVSPDAHAAFEAFYNLGKDAIGFDPHEDLLANIESEYVVAQPALDTSAPLTFLPAVAVSMPVKNEAKVLECIQKLGVALEGLTAGQQQGKMRLKKIEHRGKTIYYFSQQVLAGPVAITAVDGRLLICTSFNTARRGIEQFERTEDIGSSKSFQETMARLMGKPFDANALPPSFAYSIDEGSGSGTLLMTAAGLGAGTAALGLVAQMPAQNAAPQQQPRRGGGNEFLNWLASPSGHTVMSVLNTVDLGTWPDEAFFSKYRRPTGSASVVKPEGVFTRTELPPPGPRSGSPVNPVVLVSGAAVVAAVAIPSLLRSRIAANEVSAAASCKAYVEAQEIYRRTDYDKDGVLEFAQAMKGDNSLLESKAGAADIALVDQTLANAENGGPGARPKAGYFFKVLKAQGPNAAGGQRSYVVNGNMTLGYALVAWPSKYDNTGRDTFLINNNGTLYQADLGVETEAIVQKMTEFNPDPRFVPTE